MIVSHRHVCCFTVYRFHVKWRKTKIPDECLKNSMFYYNNGTCGFHQFIIINLDSHVHFSICTLIYIYLFIISHIYIYIIGGVYHHVSRLVFWRSHPYYIHIYMYMYIYIYISFHMFIMLHQWRISVAHQFPIHRGHSVWRWVSCVLRVCAALGVQFQRVVEANV